VAHAEDQMPGSRIAAASIAPPANLIPTYVGRVPVRALVDTGAAVSMVEQRFYDKICKANVPMESKRRRYTKHFGADKTPIAVTKDFETELKLNNLSIPVTLSVVDKLGFDLILGMGFFRQTQAVVDIRQKLLTLYGGLTPVPISTSTGDIAVVTASVVKVPPLSEAVFSVRPKSKLTKGNFLIEGSLEIPCRALMVARTLVRAPADYYPCRVMNPTSKTMTLAKGTAIGTIAPVTPEVQSSIMKPTSDKPTLSIEQQRNTLEEKEISLKDTALVGKDLDNLIELLYKNIDIMATRFAELPGTNVMLHPTDRGRICRLGNGHIDIARPTKLKFQDRPKKC
jgi:predicted aspartyl protease